MEVRVTFRGKVAVVTGAASGIGRALAVGFAQRGADVAVCDVNEVGLEETKHEVERLGRRVFTRRVDVSDREAVHAFAGEVLQHFGQVDPQRVIILDDIKATAKGYQRLAAKALRKRGVDFEE